MNCGVSAIRHELSVYVMDRDVAVLAQSGNFMSLLSCHANTAPDDFVCRVAFTQACLRQRGQLLCPAVGARRYQSASPLGFDCRRTGTCHRRTAIGHPPAR